MTEQHRNDLFYDTQHLTVEQIKDLFQRAKAVCYNWWADELDCSKSWARQRIEATFDEMLDKITEGRTHFVVIHRRTCGQNHLEISYRTMTSPADYFLWVEVTMEHKDDLIGDLKPRK